MQDRRINDRREIERRAPQRCVTTRYGDVDYVPKRIKKARLAPQPNDLTEPDTSTSDKPINR